MTRPEPKRAGKNLVGLQIGKKKVAPKKSEPPRREESTICLKGLASGRGALARLARYNSIRRKRRALPTTETELMLMAAAAIMGLSSRPKKG